MAEKKVPSPKKSHSQAEASTNAGDDIGGLLNLGIGTKFSHPPTFYRSTTLGETLEQSLLELVLQGKLTPDVAEKVMVHFDVHMASGVARATPRTTFATEKIMAYNEIKKVYSFLLSNAEISTNSLGDKDRAQLTNVDVMRIEMHPSSILKKRLEAGLPVIDEEDGDGPIVDITNGTGAGRKTSGSGTDAQKQKKVSKSQKKKAQETKKAKTKASKRSKKVSEDESSLDEDDLDNIDLMDV